MRKLFTTLVISIVYLTIFSSCESSEKHFLTDKDYRIKVKLQFEERKKIAEPRSKELFSVFDREDLTLEEREALEFLFAYMPLSDLADYDGDYFLNQVRGAFKSREYFDWGRKVPEELFRHFVLVYRVNTENLDNARDVFFDELKDRVKGMTMEEAVLEVNHWCHEKITYRATDRRTSSPLQLMKTSWGRCGEQSTFTTMALRAVGIPARQCYTPRWVHSDDNHAWVEAWVDGKWRYIGASEPEPELDIAWFTGPAKRAMMVHTNVFGVYTGSEDKTVEEPLYSVLNVLDTYADTRRFSVKVIDANSNEPIEGAIVKFEVYNYAQFSPIATIKTNKDGIVELKTNKEGDIYVWAQNDNLFGYKHVTQHDLENTIVVQDKPIADGEDKFVMRAPASIPVRELTPEQIAQNALLLAKEDSIRNVYMSTFITEDTAKQLAKDNKLDANKVWNLLSLSQGNWKDISEFIVENKDNKLLFPFLDGLMEKELRDTPKAYLIDHLTNGNKFGVKQGTPESLCAKYVYGPHIAFELIRPWRTFFQSKFSKEEIEHFQENPASVIEYVKTNISITDSENYYNCPLTPQGVFDLKLADKHSRNIFFVALCRSFGIAAQLDLATLRPQYYDGQWKDVLFEALQAELPKGRIIFTDDKANVVRPSYSTYYTIATFNKNEFTALNYRNEESLKKLPGVVTVDATNYRLTIGNRGNDGSVTVLNKFFSVGEGETVTEIISIPQPESLVEMQGTLNLNTTIELDNGSKPTIDQQMGGKGLVLVFADPDKEPTKHILQDLPAVSEEMNNWGGSIIFVVPDDKKSAAFDASAFPGLPTKSLWATDNNRQLLNKVSTAIKIDFANNFPLVVYVNKKGEILYSHQGYTIGIGEIILKTIKLEEN